MANIKDVINKAESKGYASENAEAYACQDLVLLAMYQVLSTGKK